MYESFMMFQHIMKRSVEVKSVAALFKVGNTALAKSRNFAHE